MAQFKKNLGNLQPQLVSIVLVTLIILVLAFVLNRMVKKASVGKAPKGFLLLMEQYVIGVDELVKSITKGNLKHIGPYIFMLLTFLIVGNLIGLLGFYPPVTSYSVPLVLGLVAWGGTHIVGIFYQRFRYLIKFLVNPMEILAQFAPLISISFRIFGNIIGGVTIMYLLYHVTGYIWSFVPVLGRLNLLGILIAPTFHAYFDVFSGLIQAFVFALLTAVYWGVEAVPHHSKKPKTTAQTRVVVFSQQSSGPHAIRKS